MGWVLWREPSDVPDDLVFHINYLGSGESLCESFVAASCSKLHAMHCTTTGNMLA
jgi:glutamate/tyrosine decarboxylase-like PLP-dependent enzyme